MRTISDAEIRSLKGSTDASYKLGGGVTQFTLLTRVNVSTLSKYASFNDENNDFLIPVDVAIESDRRAQSPIIVSAMASMLGYELVPLDAPLQRREINEQFATEILSETMDVSKAIIEARQDGRIDAAERKRIRKEVKEAIRALQQVEISLDGEGK